MRKIKGKLILALTVTLLAINSVGIYAFDDIGGHWSSSIITAWTGTGVLRDNDATFRPDANITRAEFFEMLVNALKITNKANISQFTDVKSTDWYYEVIQKAYAAGLTAGTSGNTMSPNSSLRRSEAMTVLSKEKKLASYNYSVLSRFIDNGSIESWAKPHFAGMVQNGYVSGDNYYRLNPNNNTTRAEALALINNMYKDRILGLKNYIISDSTKKISDQSFNTSVIIEAPTANTNIEFENVTINGDLQLKGFNTHLKMTNINITGKLYINGEYSEIDLVSGSVNQIEVASGVQFVNFKNATANINKMNSAGATQVKIYGNLNNITDITTLNKQLYKYVIGVDPIGDTAITNGTGADELASSLPNQVTVTLSDNTKTSMDVNWDNGRYDIKWTISGGMYKYLNNGTYKVLGNIYDDSARGIVNYNNIQATVNAIIN